MALESLSFMVKNKMEKMGLSYEKLSKLTGLSNTYLNHIVKHGRVPSKKQIEIIALSLHFKVKKLKEYKLMEILDEIEESYVFYDEEDFSRIKNSIKPRLRVSNPMMDKKKYSTKIWERNLEALRNQGIIDMREYPKELRSLMLTILSKLKFDEQINK